MSERVYVNRTGDKVWSPNSKEQLCEAVESLSAEVDALRRQIEPLQELAQRIVDMDDPRGSEDRRTITLNALIGQALAALSSVPDVPAARDDEIEQRFLAARREANERYDALGDEPEPDEQHCETCDIVPSRQAHLLAVHIAAEERTAADDLLGIIDAPGLSSIDLRDDLRAGPGVQVTTPEDASRAACAACDGSCGTCPYVAVTTPEEQQ